MERNVNVLLVGSLGVDDLLVRTELERGSFSTRFAKTASMAELEERLAHERWDIVVLGLEGGLVRNLDLIRLLKQSYPELPVLVISGEPGEHRAVAAMKAGADDYLMKDNPSAILPAVENLISGNQRQSVVPNHPEKRDATLHLSHSLRDILYVYDIQSGTITVQDQFGAIFSQGESVILVGEFFNAIILPHDKIRLLRSWKAHSELRAELWNCQYRVRGVGGRTLPVEDHGYIEKGAQGEILRIVGVLVVQPAAAATHIDDITSQPYQSLFEDMREGVVITDEDGNAVQANSAALEMFGVGSESEIFGENIQGFLFSHSGSAHHFTTLQRQGYLQSAEVTIERPHDDGPRYLLVSASRHAAGDAGRIDFILSDVTSLKNTEQALRESEQRHRAIVDTARAVIVLLSMDGTILEWNREAEELFGVQRSDAIGTNYLNRFLPTEEVERVKLEMARVQQGRRVVGFENHVLCKHDTPHLIQWSASALEDDANNSVSVLAIGMDVTDRRRAEQQLIDKEANLSAVIENTRDSIWSVDTNYNVRTINSVFREKMLQLYGVDLSPGMCIIDYVPESIRAFWLEHYNKALGGESYSIEARFGWNSQPRDYEVSFNPMYQGRKIIGVSVFARDITERVQDTTALENHQRRDMLLSTISRNFLNNPLEEVEQTIESAMEECVLFTHTDAAFLVMTSEDIANEIEGICHFQTKRHTQQIQTLFDTRSNCRWWSEVLDSGTERAYASLDELPANAGNEKRLFESMDAKSVYILPLKSQDKLIGVFCCICIADNAAWSAESLSLFNTVGELIANVLDRKRAYDRVKIERMMLAARVEERTSELRAVNAELARASRLKDEFLANMSHELRTPLTAILGLAESLQEQLADSISEKQRNALAVIDESGRHLYSLINDILDLSKIEAGHLTVQFDEHDVDLLCKSSLLFIRQMALKKNLHVEYKNPDAKLSMNTDGTRLKQVLVNLLNNAVKFTPEGGTIALTVKPRESRNEIEFEVSDTGIGIEERHMSRLFKPFVQLDSTLSRQYEGTGLGLALVASLTDMLGGNVSVESAPREGSRFTVTLPITVEQPALSSKAEVYKKTDVAFNDHRPPHVLLAEDNESNIFTIQTFLQDNGVHVAVARDGFEVLEMIRVDMPDIILMDIQMPGISGTDTIRRIRMDDAYAHIPILALTALAMPGDKERCMKAGADGYILKPLKLDELKQTIHDYMIRVRDSEEV